MNCACSCGLIKSVVAVGGLVIVGLGGYNLITTGCPLGTCSAEAKLESSLTPVSATTGATGCCGALSDECTDAAACDVTDKKQAEQDQTAAKPESDVKPEADGMPIANHGS